MEWWGEIPKPDRERNSQHSPLLKSKHSKIAESIGQMRVKLEGDFISPKMSGIRVES